MCFAFVVYGDFLRQMPKKKRRLIDLHSDDENPSNANAEKPVGEVGYYAEVSTKESPIGD